MKYLYYISIFLLIISSAQCQNKEMGKNLDFSVVPGIELEKYLGTWYEIARFDHRFERGLVGVKANYAMRNDGLIKVTNSGFKDSLTGTYKESVGKAKIPNPKENSKLKVSFFWIFYGDYFILELEENYQWAVIGSSSENYLWILSRTPQLEPATQNHILELIKKRGYNIDKLIFVEQAVN